MNVTAFARKKAEPMVRGLVPQIEQENVLTLLERSLVFLSPATIGPVLMKMPWPRTAWNLANLYLASYVAEPSRDALGIVGLSAEHLYVSVGYFHRVGRFEDFVVHEMAHTFHNCKRATAGLRETRRREWLLDIDYRKRETFAYACEVYSRILEIGGAAQARERHVTEIEEREMPPDELVDPSESGADPDPRTIVKNVDRMLRLDGSLGVSAIVGLVDPEASSLTFVNAGHPGPLAVGEDMVELIEQPRTLPLGMIGREEVQAYSLQLVPSQLLVFYTDGLIELDRDIEANERRLRDVVLEVYEAKSSHPTDEIRRKMTRLSRATTSPSSRLPCPPVREARSTCSCPPRPRAPGPCATPSAGSRWRPGSSRGACSRSKSRSARRSPTSWNTPTARRSATSGCAPIARLRKSRLKSSTSDTGAPSAARAEAMGST